MRTLNDFKKQLELKRDALKLKIVTHRPSIGYTAGVYVKETRVGFDWDSGDLLLIPDSPLVDLRDTEELLRPFHAFYDQKINAYEAGTLPIDDADEAFKWYQSLKSKKQTLEAIKLEFKLESTDEVTLDLTRRYDQLFYQQIQNGNQSGWEISLDAPPYLLIKRKSKKSEQ